MTFSVSVPVKRRRSTGARSTCSHKLLHLPPHFFHLPFSIENLFHAVTPLFLSFRVIVLTSEFLSELDLIRIKYLNYVH